MADQIIGGLRQKEYSFTEACLTGQRSKTKQSHLGTKVHLVGVQFTANGLFKLFPTTQENFLNEIFDAQVLFGPLESFQMQLAEAPSFKESCQILDFFLLNKTRILGL